MDLFFFDISSREIIISLGSLTDIVTGILNLRIKFISFLLAAPCVLKTTKLSRVFSLIFFKESMSLKYFSGR